MLYETLIGELGKTGALAVAGAAGALGGAGVAGVICAEGEGGVGVDSGLLGEGSLICLLPKIFFHNTVGPQNVIAHALANIDDKRQADGSSDHAQSALRKEKRLRGVNL